MQEHKQGKLECKLIANNMYSVIYKYVCEKATLKSSDPTFEKSDMKEDSVTALIIDLCPNFTFTNKGFYPNISCAEWDINAVPWAMFKCRINLFSKLLWKQLST